MTRPWEAERAVSIGEARGLIERQFPELSPATVAPFGIGWDNVAYLVNDAFVFRFPQRQLGADCMASEINVLPRIIDRLPLAIPRLKFIGSADGAYPWSFAGYPLVEGRTACSAALTAEQRTAMAAPLAGFLRSLHSISYTESVEYGAPPCTIGRLDLSKRLPQTAERIAQATEAALIDDPSPYQEILRKTQARFGSATFSSGPDSVLVHGDLYARHLLVDAAGRLCGVIDWGDVHYGAAANDLMIAHSFLPRDAHAAFRETYGSIDEDAWQLARFRALSHSATVLLYAASVRDTDLLRESRLALHLLGEA